MATKKTKKASEPFTEKKLLVWLRSAMRSASRRYPPLYEALADAKEPYVGDNARQKVCYRCAECLGTFPSKMVAVDHIVDCGSLTSWDDIQGFMQRLFCTKEGLQILCHDCHDLKTYMSKSGLNKEEAKFEKKVIEKTKQKAAAQVAQLKALGYNDVSNPEKRRKAWVEIISKEMSNGITKEKSNDN